MTFDEIVRQDTAERFRLGLPAATWQEKRSVVALLPPLNPRQGHSVPELIWGFRRLREAQATRRLPPVSPMPQRAAVKDNGPLTVDRAARTVEVIWATGVRSRNMVQSLGWITEELDMSAGAVRMAQLRSGYAPVLNTHGRGSVRDVLGRVLLARIENGVSGSAGGRMKTAHGSWRASPTRGCAPSASTRTKGTRWPTRQQPARRDWRRRMRTPRLLNPPRSRR